MKPEEKDRVQSLFHRATELPTEDRSDFLARACEGDEGVRREVEHWLALDREAERFFADPLFGDRRGGDNPAQTPRQKVGRIFEILRRVGEGEAKRDLSSSQLDTEFLPDVFADTENTALGSGAGRIDLREHRFASGALLAERYHIVRLIGTGGMGEVYRAEDLKLRQTVAIKVLGRSLERDQRLLQSLLDEVRIARQISHPNVCRVYDVGEGDGFHFISMEYIEGEDLASLLHRSGRLPREQAFKVGVELCRGLAAAHQQGVLHRDFKPANLMIDTDGRARVTDFGLAVLAERITGTEARSGTPAYMAPEQHAGREATEKSDLYALGLVLYELFTGERAFRGESKTELARLHREVMPIRPSSLSSGISPLVERVILDCLAKDPAARPASVLAVERALADGAGSSLRALLAIEIPGEEKRLDEVLDLHEGLLLDRSGRLDGSSLSILLFDRPINAVRFALAAQLAYADSTVRIGIHLGEVFAGEPGSGLHRFEVAGSDLEVVERLSELGVDGQILISRGAFDLARQRRLDEFPPVKWMAHGSYEVEGLSAAIEICEVGLASQAVFQTPQDGPSVRRQIVQETVSGWRPSPRLELPGRPRWVMEKKLNEGAFGEVWLARHCETEARRIFKFCYDSARVSSLQREITIFRLLKEALGDRPDITRILDWSFEEAPFYIEAEYTEGGSLAEWVAEQGGLEKVSLDQRLEIVAQVATALAAAHSVGVLHKDVKPGNVLITDSSPHGVQAKLNDFGLGLLTEKRHLDDLAITALGFSELPESALGDSLFAGTRLYMAPELLEGRPATVQTDIYALGVLLYQMVVGDLTRALAPGWEREISDRLLREDIARAVDGAPEERLANAAQIAERLRHLEERRADRDALRRRLLEAEEARRTLAKGRRRRRLVAGALALLLIFSAITLFQARRIASEAEKAREAANALLEMFRAGDPGELRDRELTIDEFLDLGLLRLETQLAADSPIWGPVRHTIGTVYGNLGKYERAVAEMEKALVSLRRRHGENHPEIAAVLNTLADVKREQGRLEEAETLSRQALDMRREVFGEDHPAVAESLENYGEALLYQGQIEQAEASFRQALDLRLSISGADDLPVASIMVRLASLLGMRGSLEEAEIMLRRALEIRQRSHRQPHPDIAESLQVLADLFESQGKAEEAKNFLLQALDMRRELLGDEHPDVAKTVRSLAILAKRRGDLAVARERFEEAREIAGAGLGEEHTFYGTLLEDLGKLERLRGEWAQAETFFQEALRIRLQLGKQHSLVAGSYLELADLSRMSGRFQDAKRYWQEALEIYRALYSEETPWYAYALRGLALVDFASGDPEQAATRFADALAIAERYPTKSWQKARIQSDYAAVLQALGRDTEAIRMMEASVDHYTRLLGPENGQLAYEWQDQAELLLAVGKPDAAGAIILKAVEKAHQLLPPTSWQRFDIENSYGWYLAQTGEVEKAEALLISSCSGLRQQLGDRAPKVRSCQQRLDRFYEVIGVEREATAPPRPVDIASPSQTDG